MILDKVMEKSLTSMENTILNEDLIFGKTRQVELGFSPPK